MEEKALKTGRAGETSLRLSEIANEALSRLAREWKASSKKEALEAMIRYFKKLGISPLEEVPDTIGKRLEKRVDQVIAFIRQNEKIHREEIEKVMLQVRQQPARHAPDPAQSTGGLSEINDQLDDIRSAMETLRDNESRLAEAQGQISENVTKQNELVSKRLIQLKDAAVVAQLIRSNLKLYTDSVLARPQERQQYEQKLNDFIEVRLGLKS